MTPRTTTIIACDVTTGWSLDTNNDGVGIADSAVKSQGSASIKYTRTVDKVRNRTCTLRHTFTNALGFVNKFLLFDYRWDSTVNVTKIRFINSAGTTVASINVSENITPNVWHTARVPLHGIVLEEINRIDIFNEGDQYSGWTDGVTWSLWLDNFRTEQPVRRSKPRAVVLQFDDGYKDNHTTALPLFKQYGHVATIGMVTNFFNSTYLTLPMLSESELADLAKAGWEIASHTVNHVNMSSANAATILSNMRDSKSALETLGHTVNHFIYPFTQYNATSYNESKNHYSSARIGTPPRHNSKPSDSTVYGTTDPYLLAGQAVTVTTNIADIKKSIDDAMRYETLLILYFHDINSAGGSNSCTVANLEEILKYLNANSIGTMQTTQALKAWGYIPA